MEQGFFNPTLGYWQTNSVLSEEEVASYPLGTVEVPIKPGADHRWDGLKWVHEPMLPSVAQNKGEASQRLAATDWVNQPDVYDPACTPHLVNRQAYLDYRAAVRRFLVGSVAGNLDWPTEPAAVWSAFS